MKLSTVFNPTFIHSIRLAIASGIAFISFPAMSEIHSFNQTNYLLDGNSQRFQIRVICPDAFEISSLFVTVRDPDNRSQVKFTGALGLANIMGPGYLPPFGWNIEHDDFGPITATQSVRGNELLSKMNIEKPLGIASGGSFDILGSRLQGNGNERISVAAVVETNALSADNCRIVVVDN